MAVRPIPGATSFAGPLPYPKARIRMRSDTVAEQPKNLTPAERQALERFAASLATLDGLAEADLEKIASPADSDRFHARFLGVKGEITLASSRISKLPLRGEGYAYAGDRLDALRRGLAERWEQRRAAVGGAEKKSAYRPTTRRVAAAPAEGAPQEAGLRAGMSAPDAGESHS